MCLVRWSCFVDHRKANELLIVYCSILDDFDFKLTFHIDYMKCILPFKDDLPKFKDFSIDFDDFGNIAEKWKYKLYGMYQNYILNFYSNTGV